MIFLFKERVIWLEMIDKAHTIWGSDALLIHVQRGLGKLKSQTFSEEEKGNLFTFIKWKAAYGFMLMKVFDVVELVTDKKGFYVAKKSMLICYH